MSLPKAEGENLDAYTGLTVSGCERSDFSYQNRTLKMPE
jgi:hypothetical protein